MGTPTTSRGGHIALALEYHGGRWFSDYEELPARVLPLIADGARMRAIGRAALEVLLAEPDVDETRLSGFGLGAGGSILLELLRDDVPFQALGLVHPGLPETAPGDWPADRPGDWDGAQTSMLIGTGSEDPLCTPDQVLAFGRALQAAGVDWRAHIYGSAKHGSGTHPYGSTARWRTPTSSLTSTSTTPISMGGRPGGCGPTSSLCSTSRCRRPARSSGRRRPRRATRSRLRGTASSAGGRA